jgi:Zn-finger nucleic acid-binding protein
MKDLLSQVAQLIGTAAEEVARHARALSGQPAKPAPAAEPAPAPRAESLVHLVACDSCRAQYDVTGYASSSLRCRCGHLVKVRPPAVVQRPIQRCGACGGPLEDGSHACRFCGGQVEREARALSLLCPECFAANPRKGQFCRGCGVALAPEPVGAAAPTGHSCPVCAVPLFQRRLSNTWVEECNECHGLFIAAAHFEHLAQQSAQASRSATAPASQPAPAALPPLQAVVYRRCPECNQLMQRRNYGRASGVIVDECKLHGHWLDANELEAIARFISSGEQARVRRRETQEAQRAAEDARHREFMQRPDRHAARRQLFTDALLGDD